MEFAERSIIVGEGGSARELPGIVALDTGLAYCQLEKEDTTFHIIHMVSGKRAALAVREERAQAIIIAFAEIAGRYQFSWEQSLNELREITAANPAIREETAAAVDEQMQDHWTELYGPADEEEEEKIPEDTKETQRIATNEALFTLTVNGLVAWPFPLDPDIESYLTPQHETTYMLPAEALRLADAIITRRSEYERRQQELDEQYTPLAQVVLDSLEPQAGELARQFAEWSTVRYAAYHAFTALVVAEEKHPLIEAWYQQSFAERFSHEQQEAILFQYIRKAYYARYPQES